MINPYIPQPVKILEIFQHTQNDKSFRLSCDFKVRSGQFLEISIPGCGEAPISVSDFGNGWAELTIRKVGKLTEAIFQTRVGDTIFARGPYGNGFDANLFKQSNLLIVAGGTGVAPVKSLIEHFCQNRNDINRFDIMLGFKTPGEILFRKNIENWKLNADVIVTIDNESADWNGPIGFVTQFAAKYKLSSGTTKFIIVGPPIMMKIAAAELLKIGAIPENIYVSFERRMSCGIGKCGHCKIDNQYICVDGPVFTYDKAARLLD